MASNPIPQTLPANTFVLTQAQFHALVEGWKLALKFKPPMIVMKDDILMVASNYGPAIIMADYSKLLGKMGLSMSFTPNVPVIKNMALIRGEGDINLTLNQHGHHHIQGPHSSFSIKAGPLPSAVCLPKPTWLGLEQAGYNPKDIKAFIGKQADEVQLAVYGNQLEQLGTYGQGIYTFTRGMGRHLAKRQLTVVLQSQVAFRHFGDKQSIRLGMVGKDYVLEVTNPHDMKADVVVMEQLKVLR